MYVHPATHDSLSDQEAAMVRRLHAFAESYFADPKFDASHDFGHVQRVVTNALAIFKREEERRKRQMLPTLNPLSVILGALLHDVEDRKYVSAAANQQSLKDVLADAGLSPEYAHHLQLLVDGVSYSAEVKDPAHTRQLIDTIPELAIVQDADRLDAIGAIGIGRCFTYGGAKSVRTLDDSMQHFEDKLLKLAGMMKTETGREMARERSARVQEFLTWWRDETQSSGP